MSANPTRPGTKLIAATLVISVVVLGIIVGASLNRNPSPDPTPFYDSTVCWNVVIDGEFWPNGCKGSKNKDLVCTEALVSLSSQEKSEYQRWVLAGKPSIDRCE